MTRGVVLVERAGSPFVCLCERTRASMSANARAGEPLSDLRHVKKGAGRIALSLGEVGT